VLLSCTNPISPCAAQHTLPLSRCWASRSDSLGRFHRRNRTTTCLRICCTSRRPPCLRLPLRTTHRLPAMDLGGVHRLQAATPSASLLSPQRVRLALRYRPRDSPRPSLELSALLLPLRGLRPQQSHAGRRSSVLGLTRSNYPRCCARCMAEAPLRGMTVAQPLEMQRAAPCSRIASAWS